MTPEDIPSTQPIFAAIVNFFTEDNWHYAHLEGQSALRLAFKGKNHSLDSDTIKQLVYTNVKMMDEYLPGIIAVKSGVSPADAIHDLPCSLVTFN